MLNNLDKSDFYFIIIITIIFLMFFYIKNNLIKRNSCNNTENFYADGPTTVPKDIKDAVSALYAADVESIRNLSNLASKLTQSNSLTCPGGFNVLSDLTVSGNITANDKFKVDKNGSIVLNYNNQGDVAPVQVIDLGAGDLTRQGDAGKIAYGGVWDEKCLNIVGKGIPGVPRKIKLYDQIETGSINTPYISNPNGDMRVTSKSGSALYINNDKKDGGDLRLGYGSPNSSVYVDGNGILYCKILRVGDWEIRMDNAGTYFPGFNYAEGSLLIGKWNNARGAFGQGNGIIIQPDGHMIGWGGWIDGHK